VDVTVAMSTMTVMVAGTNELRNRRLVQLIIALGFTVSPDGQTRSQRHPRSSANLNGFPLHLRRRFSSSWSLTPRHEVTAGSRVENALKAVLCFALFMEKKGKGRTIGDGEGSFCASPEVVPSFLVGALERGARVSLSTRSRSSATFSPDSFILVLRDNSCALPRLQASTVLPQHPDTLL